MIKQFHQLISLYHDIKAKNLAWKSAHQPQQLAVRQERKTAERALAEELTKRNARLLHEIEMLKTRQNADLAKLKTRCKQDLKDYRQYLASMEQLKQTLITHYPHLPEAIVFTIHHHAKNLLNAMWEAENPAEKLQLEAQLIRFMTTVHEESRRTGQAAGAMPENTLKLISQDNNPV